MPTWQRACQPMGLSMSADLRLISLSAFRSFRLRPARFPRRVFLKGKVSTGALGAEVTPSCSRSSTGQGCAPGVTGTSGGNSRGRQLCTSAHAFRAADPDQALRYVREPVGPEVYLWAVCGVLKAGAWAEALAAAQRQARQL